MKKFIVLLALSLTTVSAMAATSSGMKLTLLECQGGSIDVQINQTSATKIVAEVRSNGVLLGKPVPVKTTYPHTMGGSTFYVGSEFSLAVSFTSRPVQGGHQGTLKAYLDRAGQIEEKLICRGTR